MQILEDYFRKTVKEIINKEVETYSILLKNWENLEFDKFYYLLEKLFIDFKNLEKLLNHREFNYSLLQLVKIDKRYERFLDKINVVFLAKFIRNFPGNYHFLHLIDKNYEMILIDLQKNSLKRNDFLYLVFNGIPLENRETITKFLEMYGFLNTELIYSYLDSFTY